MGERTRRTRRTIRKGRSAEEAPIMTTTTIALDAETHRRLRHLAIEEGTSFRELIRTAITEYLARRRSGVR